jgi:hypothetical protein
MTKMKDGVRNLLYFGMLSALYVLFMAVAAYVLVVVERPFEDDWRTRMRALKENLASRDGIDMDDIEDLIEMVELGQLHGHSSMGGVDAEDGWSYGSSFLFVISIGTTVGYGHLCPGTELAKTLTACLVVISVPLTLLLTTVMVIRLLVITRRGRGFMERNLGDKVGMFMTRLLHLCVVSTLVLTIFVVLAAVVFRYSEPEWSFFEALYFSIISVSTVGLGDYVPGVSVHGSTREVYLVICSLFLVFGVVIVLLVLETLYEIPELGIHVYLLPTAEEEEEAKTDDKAHLVPAKDPAGLTYGSTSGGTGEPAQ